MLAYDNYNALADCIPSYSKSTMKCTLLLLLLCLGLNSLAMSESINSIPLKLTTDSIHDADLKVLEDGIYEIHTTGTDPYILSDKFI